jgi:membrane protease YdiL (CAAX protease family)
MAAIMAMMMATTEARQAETAALRRFLLVILLGWLVLGAGAWAYARMKSVPAWVAAPICAAFLIELPFYLLPGFEGVRDRAETLGRPRLAGAMVASALIPYLIYSIPTGVFALSGLGLLTTIVAAVAFWYVMLPRTGPSDGLFLGLLAALILTRLFNRIYADPVPRLHVEYLGHLMLIRLAAMSILALRGGSGAEFRFWPTRREWLAGVRWFAALLPCAAIVYWRLGLVEWRPQPLGLPLAAATFFGLLWVLALSEEFFFRGLLQRWLEQWLGTAISGSRSASIAALICASVLFGAAHLSFAHAFPNWRFSLVAGVAGVFYGLAWRETRSVQASMVTHALVVTVWRVFLK